MNVWRIEFCKRLSFRYEVRVGNLLRYAIGADIPPKISLSRHVFAYPGSIEMTTFYKILYLNPGGF
jgi:hypothetical protein